MIYLILIIVLGVLLTILVYSISGEPLIYPPNITMKSPINNSNYLLGLININFTSNETLNSVYYSIDGGANVSMNNHCYQEFANETTSCGGRVGSYDKVNSGKFSGNSNCAPSNPGTGMSGDIELTIDGNYSTGLNAGYNEQVFLFVNYTKPSKARRAIAQLGGSGVIKNATIPDSCFNSSSSLMGSNLSMFYCVSGDSYSSTTSSYCYNGSTFIIVAGSSIIGSGLNDETMFWDVENTTNLTKAVSNLSTEGKHNITIFGENNASTLGQTTYVYFTNNQTPQWWNNQTNVSINTILNNTAQLNVTLTDNVGLSSYILSWNVSSFWYNYSEVSISGTNITIIENKSINQSSGKFKAWTIYFNDTTGQQNQTDIFNFIIGNIIPNATNVSITPLPIELAGTKLKGHCIYSDSDNDNPIDNQTLWYVNKSIINNANNSYNLLGGNITNNTNIVFSCRYNDNYNWSDWINSSQAIVEDITPPTITNQSINGNLFITTEKINFTVVCVDNIGLISSVKLESNRTGIFANDTMTLIDSSINLYSYNSLFSLGNFNATNFYCADGSSNIARDLSNFTFTVSNPPSGSPSGNTGGGASEPPTIIYLGEKLNCASSKINYSISNIQGSTFGGYTLVTDRKNTKPKCRDFLLQNNGNESITISLKCIDTGENLTTGFCRYVELQNNTITVPPNLFVQKAVTMCIKPLDENIEGDIFYFSIKSTDDRGLCATQLSNQILTGGFNSFLAKFVSFRKIGNLNYPLLLPAILLPLALFFLFYLIFKLLKLDVLGVIISLVIGFAAFIGYLAIL